MSSGETTLSPGCPWHPDYDVFAPEELRDPYPSFKRARQESPIFYSESQRAWLVARQQDVLAVLRDTERFSSRSAQPVPLEPPAEVRGRFPVNKEGRHVYPSALTLLLMDDPEHRASRSVIQGAFTPRNVRAREAAIRATATGLFDRADDGRIDFVASYSLPLALDTVCGIVGIPVARQPLVRKAIEAMFSLLVGPLSRADADRDEVVAAASLMADYWEFLCELAGDRRANPREDYASVIAATPGPEGDLPSVAEIALHVHSIVGPGFETTVSAMTYGVALLLTHRDQWELLRADRSLIDSAITEILRYRTVVKRITRFAKTDVEVGGVRIPQGAVVALLLGSANRDEDVYEDPEAFDITRRGDNLAFGKWTHFCLGAPMARMEMKVTLEILLERFPGARIPDQPLTWRQDSKFDGLNRLDIDLRANAAAPPPELETAL
jgi:cytochrome P450